MTTYHLTKLRAQRAILEEVAREYSGRTLETSSTTCRNASNSTRPTQMPKHQKPQYRKDEPLHAYVDRVTDYILATHPDRETLRELLSRLSVQSYIEGSNAYQKVMLKCAQLQLEKR